MDEEKVRYLVKKIDSINGHAYIESRRIFDDLSAMDKSMTDMQHDEFVDRMYELTCELISIEYYVKKLVKCVKYSDEGGGEQ